MGVLSFDGSNDNVVATSLSSALAGVSNGPYTMAILLRRGAVATWDGLSYLTNLTNNSIAGLSFTSSNELKTDIPGYSGTTSTGGGFTDISNPKLIVVKKAAGSTFPRVMRKIGSGGSPAYFDMGNLVTPGSTDANRLEIGTWLNGDPFGGHIGLVGWWEGDMSDAH